MDPLAELEEEQALSDRQVDEGDAVEGATRPTSARESRQAFSVGEALSGQVDSDLVAEIDALAEGIEATEAGVDDVSFQVDVNLQSSRRGASPKTRRRSRRQSLEDSSMASTKDDAAEADFYKEEPSRMFSRGATGAGEGEVQVAVEPATILDSPSKTKKRNSKVRSHYVPCCCRRCRCRCASIAAQRCGIHDHPTTTTCLATTPCTRQRCWTCNCLCG